MTKTTTAPAAKPADRSISIGIKFIALNIGKREIRLSTEEAVQLRNELDSLLRASSFSGSSGAGQCCSTAPLSSQLPGNPVQEA